MVRNIIILSKNIVNIYCTNHIHFSYYLKINYQYLLHKANTVWKEYYPSPSQKFINPWFNINTISFKGGDIQTRIEFGRTIQLASTSRISLSEGSPNCDNHEDDVGGGDSDDGIKQEELTTETLDMWIFWMTSASPPPWPHSRYIFFIWKVDTFFSAFN